MLSTGEHSEIPVSADEMHMSMCMIVHLHTWAMQLANGYVEWWCIALKECYDGNNEMDVFIFEWQ